MNSFQWKAVIAGIGFGIYPLLLSRCGLKGNLMGGTFSFFVALFIIPFCLGSVRNLAFADWRFLCISFIATAIAFASLRDLGGTKWHLLLGAAAISSVSMMCMIRFISFAPVTDLGLLIILMLVMQAVVTAAYQMWTEGRLGTARLLGFVCAAAAIGLLNYRKVAPVADAVSK